MIIPHPESDMSLNLMVVSSDIIRILKDKKDYVLVDNALKEFMNNDERRTQDMFFNSVTFLFSIGIISEQNYKMRLTYGDA
jgi:hypothetical protein